VNGDGHDRAADRVRYRFPPLERRGVIAGWRGGQVATVACGLVVAVLAVRSRPSLSGVAVAVVVVGASVALAFWPVAGRTGEQWVPVLVRWARAGVTGRRFVADGGPVAGHRVGVHADGPPVIGPAPDAPTGPTGGSVFDGLRVVGSAGEDRAEAGFGMVVDERARTVTAVLAVRGHSFALLGAPEQDARVASWAGVLAAFAREGSAVHRLQWIETCLPDDGRAVRAHLADHGVLDPAAAASVSYRSLLDESAPVTRRHRVLVAVTVHRGRSARAVRAAGGGLDGAAVVLGREVGAVHRALGAADLAVDGVLGRDSLRRVLADAFRPASAVEGHSTGGAGPWPMGTGAQWASVRTDGAWHAVYWVSDWPRVDVRPDFLGPLLFAPLRRTLAVVLEPVDPVRAARQVAQARTAGLADGELRRRNGFLSTARHAREYASVEGRDEELADGHAQFRFSGYLGVTADSEAELVAACAAAEQAAGQSRLEVRRLYGQQDAALLCVLPLGRGLS
jgi:hypothetical protein